ncbi:MAG: hypothetical protein AAFR79_11820 [Pseudomonadota bacterium]
MRIWPILPILALGVFTPLAVSAQDVPGLPSFSAQVTGDWVDPRVHRCGQVWVRIAVEGGSVQHYTVTYGNAVPGMTGKILEIGEDGDARIYNSTLAAEQRVRFVTPDAHVLERLNGAGGVTFVRCPRSGDGTGS